VQFVSKGRVTAISQYFTHCHFPQLAAAKDQLHRAIVEFAEQAAPALPFESLVLDLMVDMRVPDVFPCRIIEVNPFMRATDTCLFSWVMDEHVLLNGPSQIRIVQSE
jgi:hypothetical protein